VSTNVEPEEAEAINAIVQEGSSEETPAAVVQRNFNQPRRFSGESLVGFQRSLTLGLPQLDKRLRELFKCPLRTEALEVSEVSAEGIFDQLEAPFALAGFTIAGQPAWIQWDIRAAVQAIELQLGSAGTPEPRELSHIEGFMLDDILSSVVDVVTRTLNLEASEHGVISIVEDITPWQDPGPEAEAHRLMVAIRIEGVGEGSTFHLYLPGMKSDDSDHPEYEAAAALPEHLNPVNIELGAYLGSSEIPLNDLLAIEIGDVIPLGTALSDPLQLRVEGYEFGTAEMGTHNGNRAVRIIEVSPRPEGVE
jgi:flagellar motor switch protein FliM